MTHSTSPTLAEIKRRTSVASDVLAEIQAMGPWPVPVESFNDDDIYIYIADSKKLVRQIACSDQEAKDARYIGVKVMAGQSWAKGMTAKRLSLWKPS